MQTKQLAVNLFDLHQFPFNYGLGEREEPVLDHDGLSFFAINKLNELLYERIKRFVRRFVDVDQQMSPKRI
jgi:hypothetical protein